MLKFNDTKWEIYDAIAGFNNLAYDVCVDTNNNKWFANGSGVYKFDGENWTLFSYTDMGISSNESIPYIQTGKNGNIIATLSSGKYVIYDGYKWTNTGITSYINLPNDPLDKKWVKSKNGDYLYKFNGVNIKSWGVR